MKALKLVLFVNLLTLQSILTEDDLDSYLDGLAKEASPNKPDSSSEIKDDFDSYLDDLAKEASLNKADSSETKDDCQCVPHYNCLNGTMDIYGENSIDPRSGICPSYLDTCCKESDINETPPAGRTTSKGCGIRNERGVGFKLVERNNETQFGEFPWMVAILHEITSMSQPIRIYECGGALIHPKVVLTVAHCVSNSSKKLIIRAGEWDTQTTQELYKHQNRDVENIIVHPLFQPKILLNDVALLIVKKPFNFAEHVDIVCLPPPNLPLVDGTRCFSMGWGKDMYGQRGTYQVILKKTDLPIFERKRCERNLRATRLGHVFRLHKSFICAGGEKGKDMCLGDGGSPLVCPIPGQPNKFFQAGMVAWGIGCGEENVPGVYVNIPRFRNWIDEQLKINNISNITYNY